MAFIRSKELTELAEKLRQVKLHEAYPYEGSLSRYKLQWVINGWNKRDSLGIAAIFRTFWYEEKLYFVRVK